MNIFPVKEKAFTATTEYAAPRINVKTGRLRGAHLHKNKPCKSAVRLGADFTIRVLEKSRRRAMKVILIAYTPEPERIIAAAQSCVIRTRTWTICSRGLRRKKAGRFCERLAEHGT
ncbi:MAG: hypothetical protein V8T36_11135 [Ruthenibacterium lactatiformans]